MKKPIKLSPEQQKAMAFIEQHGLIQRYEGGWWSYPNCEMKPLMHNKTIECYYPADHIGTNTVNALINKGLIKVSKQKQSSYGMFAIECVKI